MTTEPFRSIADAAQAYLEGDGRQQDAAARWLDSRPRFCHHPRAATVLHPGRPRWVRVRKGRGWALRRVPAGPGTHVRRCPDCPAWVCWTVTPGLVYVPQMLPWLLPTTVETGTDCNRRTSWA